MVFFDKGSEIGRESHVKYFFHGQASITIKNIYENTTYLKK